MIASLESTIGVAPNDLGVVPGPAASITCSARGIQTSLAIASRAVQCLLLEVDTWPKPGLVSHRDCGSHVDMNGAMFVRSAHALEPYFAQLAQAGAEARSMAALRQIGVAAEFAMHVATAGINTHRGAIFGLGLLCAAAGSRSSGPDDSGQTLGEIVAYRWGSEIASTVSSSPSGDVVAITGPLALPAAPGSHGAAVRRRYGVGGAPMEAARGFPSVYQVALPALRHGYLERPDDLEAARVQACFALIGELLDTNLLHRGGEAGLRFAQRTARQFIDQGGVRRSDWREQAAAIHQQFIERRLSPGGTADLLSMALFVDLMESRRGGGLSRELELAPICDSSKGERLP